MRSKRKALVIKELKGAHLVTWSKSVLSKLRLGKGSRAGIIVNKAGVPQLFVLDTPAMLDILSTIDEALVDRLSDKEYNSRTANPAGWLIDEIEAKLPLDQRYVQSLKDAIEEAERQGWIPFKTIQKKLGLT